MALSLEDMTFELQRGFKLFKSTTSMPDGTSLLWDADPNTVVCLRTGGETLLHTSPLGTIYMQEDGTMWQKVERAQGGKWVKSSTSDTTEPERIISPDTLWTSTVTDTDFTVKSGTTNRIEATASGTKILTINDSSNYMKVLDTSIGFVWEGSNALHINNTSAKLTSKDGNNYIKLKNASVQVLQGNQERMWMDSATTDLRGPAQVAQLKLEDDQLWLELSGGKRSWVTNTGTFMLSPDQLQSFQITNTGMSFTDVRTTPATIVNRLQIDLTTSKLGSPDDLQKLLIDDTGTIINDGTWNRLGVTAVTTILVNPDGSNALQIDNTGLSYNDSGVNRIAVDGTVLTLLSPNGLESITVDNNGAFYNTKQLLTVSSGVQQPVARSSTDNGVARFDGTDGSRIQSSNVKITDNDILEFDNSRFITTSITTGQNEDNMVGPLLADLWVVVPTDVTRFTVRDLDNNINPFNVRVIFIDGTDELTLTRGHDNVEFYKISSVWYFYNIRTGLGRRVSA